MEFIFLVIGVIIGFILARIYQKRLILDVILEIHKSQEDDEANWWKNGKQSDYEDET